MRNSGRRDKLLPKLRGRLQKKEKAIPDKTPQSPASANGGGQGHWHLFMRKCEYVELLSINNQPIEFAVFGGICGASETDSKMSRPKSSNISLQLLLEHWTSTQACIDS